MKNFIDWFVTSSADPEKVSLTLKSLAAIVVFFGVDSSVTNQGVGYLVTIISSVGMLISAATGIWGLTRKLMIGQWSAK